MKEPDEVLNGYEKEVIKLYRECRDLKTVAERMELPVSLITNTVKRLKKTLQAKCGLGTRRPKSEYFYAMCPRCCTRTVSEGSQFYYCEKCDPPHKGVGCPGGQDGLDKDPDAFMPSWRTQ